MSKAKTVESKEVMVISPEEQAYINKVKQEEGRGQSTYTGPNSLVINEQAKDADGVRRPIGGWHIKGTDKYFDGEILFRPITFFNKIIRYSQDASGKWNIAGQSVYFKDYSAILYDNLGGIALGRKFGAQYSAEEKAAVKSLGDVYVDIFGIATFGDEEIPCRYRIRGTKIKTILDAFKSVPKDKLMSQYNFKLETNQPEGTKYWDVNITPDMSKVLRLTSDIIKFDEDVHNFVKEENESIVAAYNNARANKTESNIIDSTLTDITPVDANDDELPF